MTVGGASQDPQSPSSESTRGVNLPFVLIADASGPRAAACMDAIRPYNLGVLVARDGAAAIRILERIGPPRLLIADLSLSQQDGFAVIEALRGVDTGRTRTIAWSSTRELREFAVSRLGKSDVRVLSGSVAPHVIRAAIERALDSGPAALSVDAASSASAADEDLTPGELSDRARHCCDVPGVAVYLRTAVDAHVRASISWTSDAPVPQVVNELPGVLERILQTGDGPSSTSEVRLGGVVAVPIVAADQRVVGAICVFDATPVVLERAVMAKLEALGRGTSGSELAERPRAERPSLSLAVLEAPAARADDSVEAIPAHLPAIVLERRDGNLAVVREVARARRELRPLSVILLGVKAAPPRGPVAATPVDPIAAVSTVLIRAIRGSDLAIRWTPDSLLVVLTGYAESQARPIAERVRAALQAGARGRVAVSGGVAELQPDESFEAVINRAGEKVRLACERGHNRIG